MNPPAEQLKRSGAVLTGPWTLPMAVSALSGRVITPEDRQLYNDVLDVLINEFISSIDTYKSKGDGKIGQVRLDMFDTYLKIYDLKENHTYKQIAEIVYPNDKNLDSSIQKVKRNYYEVKKLVEGGYVDIR